MSAETHQGDLSAECEPTAEVAASGSAAGEGAPAAAEASALAARVEELEGLVQKLEDEKMRVAADFANYQKRVNRDRAKWTEDAVRDAVSGLLPVLDNLEHAIAAFEGQVKDAQVYRQGVELVQSEMLRVLQGYGLQPVDASAGCPFDPDRHQAISLVPAEDVSEEVVAAVARTGYMLGEVVLRPAQVVVKKPSA